jgi:hypothetical protein
VKKRGGQISGSQCNVIEPTIDCLMAAISIFSLSIFLIKNVNTLLLYFTESEEAVTTKVREIEAIHLRGCKGSISPKKRAEMKQSQKRMKQIDKAC